MELKWRRTFLIILRKFCNCSYLHGWKYLMDKRRTKLERLFWWIIQIVASSSAIYLFYLVSENFWFAPTITTLDNANYPINEVPFPAVAICDINRISKKSATLFAKDRAVRYNVSWEKMLYYTKYLGRLYDYDDDNIEILNEFSSVLDASKSNLQFDYLSFVNVMLNLTPPMSTNILECIWKTEIINCSDIFNFRRTMDGFCGTFNYEKSSDHVFIKSAEELNPILFDTKYLGTAGPEMGLTLVLKSDVNDYYYPRGHLEGLKIFVYNNRDYPDTTSGGLVESLIPLGYEVFLKIEPVTVKAVDILRTYTIKQRQCIFEDERTTAFDSKYYSQSDCINDCKMKSILALCECIPFYMAISNKLPYSKQLCTTADVPCLNKYQEKWNTITPANDKKDYENLASDIQNSIQCADCLPQCSYTLYSVANEYAPLAPLNNTRLSQYNLNDISLVHIYFDTESTMLYKTDLVYYWFDIISNFGGMCGVFIGFSIISAIEMLYYFIFHFAIQLFKTRNTLDSQN